MSRLNFDINSPSRETQRSGTVTSRASGSSTSARNGFGPTRNIAQTTNTVIGRSWTVDTINLNDTVDEQALNTIYQDADSINSSQGAQFHSFGDDSPNSSVIQMPITPTFANLEITRSEPTNIGRQPNSTSANSPRSRIYQSEPISSNSRIRTYGQSEAVSSTDSTNTVNTIDRRRSMRRTNQIKNFTIRRRKSDQHKNEVITKIDDVLENGELGFTLTTEGKKLLNLCKQEILNLNKDIEKGQKENERMVSEIETLEEAILCPICYDNYVNLQPGKPHKKLAGRDPAFLSPCPQTPTSIERLTLTKLSCTPV